MSSCTELMYYKQQKPGDNNALSGRLDLPFKKIGPRLTSALIVYQISLIFCLYQVIISEDT